MWIYKKKSNTKPIYRKAKYPRKITMHVNIEENDHRIRNYFWRKKQNSGKGWKESSTNEQSESIFTIRALYKCQKMSNFLKIFILKPLKSLQIL